jgi:hypothetical protein
MTPARVISSPEAHQLRSVNSDLAAPTAKGDERDDAGENDRKAAGEEEERDHRLAAVAGRLPSSSTVGRRSIASGSAYCSSASASAAVGSRPLSW